MIVEPIVITIAQHIHSIRKWREHPFNIFPVTAKRFECLLNLKNEHPFKIFPVTAKRFECLLNLKNEHPFKIFPVTAKRFECLLNLKKRQHPFNIFPVTAKRFECLLNLKKWNRKFAELGKWYPLLTDEKEWPCGVGFLFLSSQITRHDPVTSTVTKLWQSRSIYCQKKCE